MSISSSPFLLLKDYLYKYISGTEGVRRDAFSYKWRGTEHCSRTQSADVDIQVSLSPYHPSCTTQGAASIKHKESLVRNKHTQPTTGTGTKLPSPGKGGMSWQSQFVPVQYYCKRKYKTKASWHVLKSSQNYVKCQQDLWKSSLI